MMFSVMISSVLTLFTQVAIEYCDWPGLIVIRFCLGIVQSVTFPVRQLEEISSMFACLGMTFGLFVMLSLSGICASYLGWSSIFYLSSGIGIIWSIFWKLYGKSALTKYSGIVKTNNENSCGQTELNRNEKNISIPWLKFVKSIPFNALLIAQYCQLFGFTILLNESPSYLYAVYGISIGKSALLSSLPFLGRFLMEFAFIGMEYQLSQNAQLPGSILLKTFNCIGKFIPAVGLAILCFKSNLADDDLMVAVVILILSLSDNAAVRLGFHHVNLFELSANHSDTLKYICDFFGNIISLIALIVVGQIVSDVVRKMVHLQLEIEIMLNYLYRKMQMNGEAYSLCRQYLCVLVV